VIRLLGALACSIALVGCGGDGGETRSWNHDPEDATLGPTGWGELDDSFAECATGTAQSPVDIAAPVLAELPELAFDYPEVPLVVENTGHVIEVPMPEDGVQTLTIDGDEHRLLQLHFHAPSEHTVGGRSSAAEAHLVHESEEGELTVVGVLLEEGEPGSSPFVDLVLENAPEEAGEEVEIEAERSPLELLSVVDATTAVASSYYTYPGSLTTPGCSEGVHWIVLPDTLSVSRASIDRLHELVAAFPGYDGYENNNRPTQPLNDRVVELDQD
jgi:carbonic anhydrase